MEPRGQRNRKVFELTSSNSLQLILIKKNKEQQEERDQTQLIMHMLDNINLKCFYATPTSIV